MCDRHNQIKLLKQIRSEMPQQIRGFGGKTPDFTAGRKQDGDPLFPNSLKLDQFRADYPNNFKYINLEKSLNDHLGRIGFKYHILQTSTGSDPGKPFSPYVRKEMHVTSRGDHHPLLMSQGTKKNPDKILISNTYRLHPGTLENFLKESVDNDHQVVCIYTGGAGPHPVWALNPDPDKCPGGQTGRYTWMTLVCCEGVNVADAVRMAVRMRVQPYRPNKDLLMRDIVEKTNQEKIAEAAGGQAQAGAVLIWGLNLIDIRALFRREFKS